MIESTSASGSVLPAAFYRRHVVDVARDLLGKWLISDVGGARVSMRIFETEAYHQCERGAHCFAGKRTKRTQPMFESGGISYVYFVYGMHWQFNVVTGPKDEGQAVLIRGAEPVGDDAMLAVVQARRGWAGSSARRRLPSRRVLADPRRWCDGPAKLCQAAGVTGQLNAISLDGGGPVWLESGASIADDRISTGPRIGIDYAQDDASLPWRFTSR